MVETAQEILDEFNAGRGRQEVDRSALVESDGGLAQPTFGLFL